VAHQLSELGRQNVRFLVGGFDAWRNEGYPLEAR
jgi:rhodanese-related sulfurtransferase